MGRAPFSLKNDLFRPGKYQSVGWMKTVQLTAAQRLRRSPEVRPQLSTGLSTAILDNYAAHCQRHKNSLKSASNALHEANHYACKRSNAGLIKG
jgi:hypothetical protein